VHSMPSGRLKAAPTYKNDVGAGKDDVGAGFSRPKSWRQYRPPTIG